MDKYSKPSRFFYVTSPPHEYNNERSTVFQMYVLAVLSIMRVVNSSVLGGKMEEVVSSK